MTGPTVHDPLTLTKGTTWTIPGQATKADGTPLDLTGATVQWYLDDLANTVGFLLLQNGSGIVVDVGTNGTFTIVVPAVQNAALLAGVYKDTLIVTAPSGAIGVQWVGAITVAEKPKAPV